VPWVTRSCSCSVRLSRDNHVFLLSRITGCARGGGDEGRGGRGCQKSRSGDGARRDHWWRSLDLATLSVIQLKMLGVGLAAEVLIDATVVARDLVQANWRRWGTGSWYAALLVPGCRGARKRDRGGTAGHRGSAGPAPACRAAAGGRRYVGRESASGGSVAGRRTRGGPSGQAAAADP